MADKGFDLASVLGSVPDLGTAPGREQIEYIDIDLIDDDPNNFYALSDLDELTANIELIGLQQPLRVRSGENGRVTIVSGHRRRAAIRALVDEGRDDLRQIPCIRETDCGSAAMQELRLIYANAATRHLTSAEIGKQAERVEALLYQLKEEGQDFPGRMRDHVAEACRVSKSKLARLKVIRDKLICEWYAHYANDKLPESTAYTIAQMPAAHQMALYDGVARKRGDLRGFYESEADRYGVKMSLVDGKSCPKRSDTTCDNVANKYKRICSRVDDYMRTTPCAGCCAACAYIGSCSYACDLCADEKKAVNDEKAAEKAAAREAEERREAEIADLERDTISLINRMWEIYDRVKSERGIDDDAYRSSLDVSSWMIARSDKPSRYSKTPLAIDGNDAKRICAAADILGVSVDYLLGRTDEPQDLPAAGASPSVPAPGAAWHSTADEPSVGAEIVVIDDAGLVDNGVYQGGGKVDALCTDWDEVMLWTPMPKGATAVGQTSEHECGAAPQFVDGSETPPHDGLYYCRFDCGGVIIEQVVLWDADLECWRFRKIGTNIEGTCLGWYPLPPDEEDAE